MLSTSFREAQVHKGPPEAARVQCNQCQVNHIIPLSKGGPDTPANMQWLPRDVHREKTKQDLYGK